MFYIYGAAGEWNVDPGGHKCSVMTNSDPALGNRATATHVMLPSFAAAWSNGNRGVRSIFRSADSVHGLHKHCKGGAWAALVLGGLAPCAQKRLVFFMIRKNSSSFTSPSPSRSASSTISWSSWLDYFPRMAANSF